MAEVILRFEAALIDHEAERYTPQVCGRRMPEGELWEGWIEFVPLGGATVLRTPRETEQSSREALAYWATGLSTTYLEGALERALGATAVPPAPAPAVPSYDAPAPGRSERAPAPAPPPVSTPRAVLNPFEVYRQGEETLRSELLALDPEHLIRIVRAHALADEAAVPLRPKTRAELAELIVAAVRDRPA